MALFGVEGEVRPNVCTFTVDRADAFIDVHLIYSLTLSKTVHAGRLRYFQENESRICLTSFGSFVPACMKTRAIVQSS